MCNTLIELGTPVKFVWQIKIFLIETYSNVRIGKYLSTDFPIESGLKQGDVLSRLLSNFPLEYVIRKIEETKNGMKLNRTQQILVFA